MMLQSLHLICQLRDAMNVHLAKHISDDGLADTTQARNAVVIVVPTLESNLKVSQKTLWGFVSMRTLTVSLCLTLLMVLSEETELVTRAL